MSISDEIPENDAVASGKSSMPGRPAKDEPQYLTGLDVGLAAAYEFSQEDERVPSDSSDAPEAGMLIAGKYRLVEKIGEGGMGTVWFTEQLVPVKRMVALKLVKPGLNSRSSMARFEAERQALALMDHPNIARVLDGGMTEQGRPYFVMELVRGTAITTFCDERKLDLHARLRLFIPVCQAIQHAHQKGIIHRDIKPSNVMIALFDDKPVPKVIDFGVAKASDSDLLDSSVNTSFGSVVGTAEYMSPEQAQLNNVDIDTRSDVYSLGVLLYELVAGSPPFRRSELVEQGMLEILRVIREVDPQLPSVKLSSSKMRATIAALRNTEPKSLGKLLRSDLDWIVMKTLEKDRVRRYDSAGGLARDIDRFLANEAVEACPPSTSYKLRKFLRRNRASAFAAGLFLLTLVAGIVGTSIGLYRAEVARKIAEAAQKAEAERAEGERLAKLEALKQKQIAEQAESDTLESYRASTDDAIEQLIGSKPILGIHERTYLEKALERWRGFADRQGNDERNRVIRAEASFRLAIIWEALGQKAEAKSDYQQAAETWEQLASDFPPKSDYQHEGARSRRNLGIILRDLGKHADSEEQLRKALTAQKKLVAEFPTAKFRRELGHDHDSLGNLLAAMSRSVEAEEQFLEAISIQEELVTELPEVPEHLESLGACHSNFANFLIRQGRPDAETHVRKALPPFEKLSTDFPKIPKYRIGNALTRRLLSGLLSDQGRYIEAEQMLRGSLALIESLAAEFPSMPDYRSRLAGTQRKLGWFLFDRLAKTAEAEEQFNKGISTLEKLVRENPNVPAYRIDLSGCHFTLGYILSQQARIPEAQEQFRTAIKIEEALASDYPLVPDYRVSLGASYSKLAESMVYNEMPLESIQWYDKAIETILSVFESTASAKVTNESLFECYFGRALAKSLLKQDTADDWKKAVETMPMGDSRQARFIRARTLIQAGRAEDAVAQFEEIVNAALDDSNEQPWSVVEWYDAACFYSFASSKIPDRQEEFTVRALDLLRRAVDHGLDDVARLERQSELDPIREREDYKQLLESMRKADVKTLK